MFDEFYKQPPRYHSIQRGIQYLDQKYHDLKVFSIGKSVLGRSIYAMGLGSIYKSTLFVGATHGMEWLTSLLLFRFMEDLLEHMKTKTPLAEVDVNHLFENRSLVIVPMLNPDGVEIQQGGAQTAKHLCQFVCRASGEDTSRWQANARGIDLNHNFDAGFAQLKKMESEQGFTAPGPTRYGGTAPFSEPESLCLANFCKAFDIRHTLSFHSQGEEIYWKYGEKTPPRAHMMAQVLASASGYNLAAPEAIASHGGFKDWFIACMERPGFTIEIGKGRNPLPVEDLDQIYADLLEMMLIAILL